MSLSRGGDLFPWGVSVLCGASVQGASIQGTSVQGSLSRGPLSKGSLSKGSLSRRSLSRGVSIQEVSVKGSLSSGSLSRRSLSRGVSVRETPSRQRPPTVKCWQYTSYCNAFLLCVQWLEGNILALKNHSDILNR